MKVIGFCQRHKEWLPVEIEVSFVPGLPQIHLIGQADAILKESLLKIKSILKMLEIELPKARQIIVNLRGGDFKKKSLDLELPILLAILHELRVIIVRDIEVMYSFGELSLEGKIFSSDLLLLKKMIGDKPLITGLHPNGLINEKHNQFLNLRELVEAFENGERELSTKERRARRRRNEERIAMITPSVYNAFSSRALTPEYDKDPTQIFFTPEESELLKVTCLGSHSLLLMGPRGLGKSTMAEALNYLAEPPDEDTFLHQMKYFFVDEGKYWRPFVRPHHSISHLALIGGGPNCMPGEITRAHGGILLMDEFLEFDPKCQEALREPMQNKSIHLARGQKFQKYDCDFHLVATTNLCPCGQWLPGKALDCVYSAARCGKYRDKLSGPVIDRFHILAFMRPQKKADKTISLQSIRSEIVALRSQFKKQREALAFNKEQLSTVLRHRLDNELGSLRRLNSTIEIAKTLSALRGASEVGENEMLDALEYTWTPFLQLKS